MIMMIDWYSSLDKLERISGRRSPQSLQLLITVTSPLNQNRIISFQKPKYFKSYLERTPTSMLSGTITKSFVLVLSAESVDFSCFKTTSSKNFLAKIAASIFYPTLIGMILCPL